MQQSEFVGMFEWCFPSPLCSVSGRCGFQLIPFKSNQEEFKKERLSEANSNW